MQIITTHSPEETHTIAALIVRAIGEEEGVRGTSTIIALQGNLGAGKTVFAKGVAETLGVKETVTSPTFVLEKVYLLPEGSPWKRMVHIDAYRLEGEEEILTIGWNALATDPHNLILIEWPEQVGLAIPERAFWIEFEAVDDTTRKLKMPESIHIHDA
jgi:tRNA threonylcarbamoyladenosine biosynthesis protein TsaE